MARQTSFMYFSLNLKRHYEIGYWYCLLLPIVLSVGLIFQVQLHNMGKNTHNFWQWIDGIQSPSISEQPAWDDFRVCNSHFSNRFRQEWFRKSLYLSAFSISVLHVGSCLLCLNIHLFSVWAFVRKSKNSHFGRKWPCNGRIQERMQYEEVVP